jgi:hypothetical protein
VWAIRHAIKRQFDIDISVEQARANFESDAGFYPVTHALRELQRFWVQRTGPSYESLLTSTSSYGADRRPVKDPS